MNIVLVPCHCFYLLHAFLQVESPYMMDALCDMLFYEF